MAILPIERLNGAWMECGVEKMFLSCNAVNRRMELRRGSTAHVVKALLLLLAALASLSSAHAQEERPALVPNSQSSEAQSKQAELQSQSVGELTIDPIQPGETVHVAVYQAPEFSVSARLSESGDFPIPVLGAVHLGGLNSATASALLESKLKSASLMLDPHVLVTVDSTASAITILGEVHSPGIYPPPPNHMLSDLLATAGGLTAATGRVIEITNHNDPGRKEIVPWDPTLRNIDNYDRPVHPGDRVVVRACGIAYVGGHVAKPGAYSLCGSEQMTVSEVISLAGGIMPLTSPKHTYLVRTQPNGSKTVTEFDINKILEAKAADPPVQEDDILYVSPSALKDALTRVVGYAVSLAGPLIYVYRTTN
jgi:protein involved in polysaccharide export with SLBB domain